MNTKAKYITGLQQSDFHLFFFLLTVGMLTACSGPDELPHLAPSSHPSGRYANTSITHVVQPFHIQVDPMEALMLINFEDDPDEHYLGFEPQLFNDNMRGQGLLVIAWRKDMRVEVYHQPGVRPDTSMYSIAGKGLAYMAERPLEGAYLRFDGQGAHCAFQFEDRHGRPIDVSVSEGSTSKRAPFGLLAPMGDAAEAPFAMPLIWLHDFYFVRRSACSYRISIGGKLHTSDNMPVPMDLQRMYFMRYSPRPLISLLNPAVHEVVPHMPWSGKFQQVDGKGQQLHWRAGEGKPELARLERRHKEHLLAMNFEPPFPQVLSMVHGSSLYGKWNLHGDPSTGYIAGHYEVHRSAEGIINIVLEPSAGWVPIADKLSLKMMYGSVEMFKGWPTRYRWEADILPQQEGWLMDSRWIKSTVNAAK